jgi:hypothetical protein
MFSLLPLVLRGSILRRGASRKQQYAGAKGNVGKSAIL